MPAIARTSPIGQKPKEASFDNGRLHESMGENDRLGTNTVSDGDFLDAFPYYSRSCVHTAHKTWVSQSCISLCGGPLGKG